MNTLERVRKSERLTPEVFEAFKHWVKTQPTKTDAAIILGVTRNSMLRVELSGSCRPDTAQKIRKVLNLTAA